MTHSLLQGIDGIFGYIFSILVKIVVKKFFDMFEINTLLRAAFRRQELLIERRKVEDSAWQQGRLRDWNFVRETC